jgi:Sulfate permease family
VLILVTVLLLTPLFKNLPGAVLAALIIHAVSHLWKVAELRRYRRERQVEFWLGVATLARRVRGRPQVRACFARRAGRAVARRRLSGIDAAAVALVANRGSGAGDDAWTCFRLGTDPAELSGGPGQRVRIAPVVRLACVRGICDKRRADATLNPVARPAVRW